MEIAIEIDEEWKNVLHIFDFTKKLVESEAKAGRYPLNTSVELRFCGAGGPW